ncbi:MAG: hypothetical protein SNJ82_07315 [Gemmataceae bacterium]
MTIRAWLHCLSGLWVCCFTIGCVFHHSARDLPPTSSQTPPTPEIVHCTQGTASGALPTPRHESTTRSAATIDPPTPLAGDPLPMGADLLPAETPVQMLPAPQPVSTPPIIAPAVPTDTEEKLPPLLAALRAVMNKHPEQAARELQNVEASRRERLVALLRLAVDVEEQALDRLSPSDVDAMLEHLQSLCQQLRPRAPLKILSACLCQSIQGFGQYERLAADHVFVVGKPGSSSGRVQLYVEVGNFGSKPLGDGRYETSLATRLEIEDANGKLVHTWDLGVCVDQSQSPRKDYYLNVQFPLPANLPAGDYSLRVIVQDITAGPPREARTTIPLKWETASR